jgi:Leucine-rich repeat (LRR) protein
MSGIMAGAFKNFQRIEELNLKAVAGLSFASIQSVFTDLNGSNLTRINLFGVDGLDEVNKSLFGHFKHNKLETLILSFTSISTIADDSFQNLVALKILLLDNTQIKVISPPMFRGLSNLEILDISSTKISDYNFNGSGLDNLRVLNMSYSQYLFHMKSNQFYGLPRLRELKLDTGAVEILEKCTFCGLYDLQILEITDVNFELVNIDAFAGLYNLTDLDLSRSGLRNLSKNTFKDLLVLDTLTLDGNALNHSRTVEPDVFRKLTSLKHLSMKTCQLTSDYGLFRGLSTLEYLSLKDNT